LLALGLVLRIVPAVLIRGTDDVSSWQSWGWYLAQGRNPYQSPYLIAWPPLWPIWAGLSYVTADVTGIPFHAIGKLLPIAADLVLIAVLFEAAGEAAAFAYALNPVSIYTTAIHGNFDALPALCLTVAVVAASRMEERRAGWWLGIGAAIKTWPLLLLPAVIAPLRSLRTRVRAAAIAIGVFAGALLVALPAGRSAVAGILSYRSAAGWWGISSISWLCGGCIPPAILSAIFYGAMAAVALLLLVKQTPAAEGTLLLLLTLFVTTPGFGLQYLVWLVPVALLADRRRALWYSALAAVLIAWEVLVRPYTGHIGETVRMLPHADYARSYGRGLDHRYTVLGRLPLWGFVCWWWLVTLATHARIRAPKLSRP
jgi:hypothetical protein